MTAAKLCTRIIEVLSGMCAPAELPERAMYTRRSAVVGRVFAGCGHVAEAGHDQAALSSDIVVESETVISPAWLRMLTEERVLSAKVRSSVISNPCWRQESRMVPSVDTCLSGGIGIFANPVRCHLPSVAVSPFFSRARCRVGPPPVEGGSRGGGDRVGLGGDGSFDLGAGLRFSRLPPVLHTPSRPATATRSPATPVVSSRCLLDHVVIVADDDCGL